MIAATTHSEAKVLRSKDNAPLVSVSKDAGAISQYNRLAGAGPRDANRVSLLLVCKVPQGTIGCEGTVPIGNVKNQ